MSAFFTWLQSMVRFRNSIERILRPHDAKVSLSSLSSWRGLACATWQRLLGRILVRSALLPCRVRMLCPIVGVGAISDGGPIATNPPVGQSQLGKVVLSQFGTNHTAAERCRTSDHRFEPDDQTGGLSPGRPVRVVPCRSRGQKQNSFAGCNSPEGTRPANHRLTPQRSLRWSAPDPSRLLQNVDVVVESECRSCVVNEMVVEFVLAARLDGLPGLAL